MAVGPIVHASSVDEPGADRAPSPIVDPPHDACPDPVNPIVETHFLKTARLAPGEPLPEVSALALIFDSEVDACCLMLLPSLDEPPLAEYWFGSLEQAERQAVTVFGARFVGWNEGEG
jgi:hypothetical protein